jgi:hypothetical protein
VITPGSELITIVYPWDISITIPLNDSSQGVHPFCYHKSCKSNKCGSGAFDSSWLDYDRYTKMERVGIYTVSANGSYQNRIIEKRLAKLEGMLHPHILENVKAMSPRPFRLLPSPWTLPCEINTPYVGECLIAE